MKYLATLLLLLLPTSVLAQCNAHKRQFKKPWTWLESNMCQQDYDKWAQPRLHDHWYKDKYFWMGVAIIGGAIAADAHSTSRGQDFGILEGNPILGPHPSNRKIAILSSVDFGAQFTYHALAWHYSHQDPSMAWRQFGRWSVPTTIVLINGRAAHANYHLETRP